MVARSYLRASTDEQDATRARAARTMTTAAAGKRKALRRRRPKANIAGGPKTQAATPGLLRCCATVRHGRRFRTPSDAAGRRSPRSPSEPRRHRTAR